jgi:hypothetical protein
VASELPRAPKGWAQLDFEAALLALAREKPREIMLLPPPAPLPPVRQCEYPYCGGECAGCR